MGLRLIECTKWNYTISAEITWNNWYPELSNRERFCRLRDKIYTGLTHKQYHKFVDKGAFNMNLLEFDKITKNAALRRLFTAYKHGQAEYRRTRLVVV